MPGPKYVTDFEFPASAGFTRSGRSDVTVRSHVRQQPVRLARGGSVRRALGAAPKSGLKPSPEAVVGGTLAAGIGAGLYARHKRNQVKQAGKAPQNASAVDAVRGNTRRRREKELGLNTGGAVRHYAKGGKVTGNATVQRSVPTTELDKVSGGKTPLRPGFKRGGKAGKKMC